MKTVDTISLILILVGAINWGLVGLFGFDLVATVFGDMTVLSRLVYVLVGAAGVYEAFAVWSLPRRWQERKTAHV